MPSAKRRKLAEENKLDVSKAEARDIGVVAVNQADAYGVRIIPAQVAAGQEYWRVISVRHLTPEENQGKHVIFVDAQDASGQRRRDDMLRIGWTWEGRNPADRADPRALDKPDNEPAGNVDMFSGQHIELWMQGDGLPSDHVANLHTNHADEPGPHGELWSTIGHHSFHVVFRRARMEAGGNGPTAGTQGAVTQPTTTQPTATQPTVTPPTVTPPAQFRFEVWPSEFQVITQKFGVNPDNYKRFGLPGHEGIDIKAPTGSKVFCVAPGQVKLVTLVGADPTKPAYGNHVRVLHAGGYETIYAHLQSVSVQMGQSVAAGQVLGVADNTGNSSGAHLHITLKHHGESFDGYPSSIIDPTPFLAPLLGKTPVPAGAGQVKVSDKLGLNCNAPTDENGNITPRLADPRLIADTGVGWVRLNFILRPFNSPEESGWVDTYRKIIGGLRGQGLRIYGLIHAQAVAGDPGNQFREAPAGSIENDWISRYAKNFRTIVQLFRSDVEVFESFNEPNDWHRVPGDKPWEQAWVHPYWFAVMLQKVYEAVRDLNVKLVAGPLLSTPFGNAAAEYLPNVYEGGAKYFNWGKGAPVPFDGVGFHPYVLMDPAKPSTDIPPRYQDYMKGVRDAIGKAENGALRPIYVSEIGFQNAEDRQVECMKVALRCALDDPAVALCFWYGMQDDAGESYGLYRKEGLTPADQKPVYKAFVDVASENRLVPVAGFRPAPQLPDAKFVAELDAVKDGTAFAPGQTFTKTWRMRNAGTTTWGDGYRFVRVEGLSLGAPSSINVPSCPPGQTADLSVTFVVPPEPATCTSTWQLVDPTGKRFGQKVWTTIRVKAAVAPPAAAKDLFGPEAFEMPAPAAAGTGQAAALGIIYTTYWLRAQAALAAADPQQALLEASNDALAQLKEWTGQG